MDSVFFCLLFIFCCNGMVFRFIGKFEVRIFCNCVFGVDKFSYLGSVFGVSIIGI